MAISLLSGLIWTPLLLLIPLAAAFRRHRRPIEWAPYHSLMLFAGIIGASVVAFRGLQDSTGLVLQYFFIWCIPFIFLYFRPTETTVLIVSAAVILIFSVDLVFNVLGSLNSSDILGRDMDQRAGTIGARMGGVFGHAFYSGSISISALVIILCSTRSKLWTIFPIINLLIAGSWRLTIAIPILFVFYIWKERKYWQEILAAACISILAVVATIYTSGLIEIENVEVNPSNTLRVFAWATALEKIQDSPFTGVGYPKDNTLDGISMQTIDESLTAESWYLGSAITFGVPYTFLRFISLLLLFAYHRRNQFVQVAGPYILIDLTYGGFFDGTLFYILMWTYIASSSPKYSDRTRLD